MTVYNLGSINIDHFYRVPHLPVPGETLAAMDHWTGLGGKGANQSVAVAQAGAPVFHIGAIGSDGGWTVTRLQGFGVTTTHVATADRPTAHAIINVDDAGENAIVIFPGANVEQSLTRLDAALSQAAEGDMLMIQNETNLQVDAARIAHEKGMFVVYSAAPFHADAVRAVLPFVDLLVVNKVEAAQLTQALGDTFEVPNLLVTQGAEGSTWRKPAGGQDVFVPSFPVDPVDTTGAGDCFIGYTVAGLDQGLDAEGAMRLGAAAAAIKVTRAGTADAIPARDEVDAFLKERGPQ
ncbi:ribokinase [Aliiroseovarius subalbicans]|uniref:ribokinase n=1 Tax=Aliiroseovarius subalbicans TaxID=2925840 RepID=UPI001F5AC702|nr:ribokinase [Aliiroseovarius subalbicans]MCI2400053.1 ribokinase [Aliiroseovarius subalbicans]